MPFARPAEGVRIYYEVHGPDGAPAMLLVPTGDAEARILEAIEVAESARAADLGRVIP